MANEDTRSRQRKRDQEKSARNAPDEERRHEKRRRIAERQPGFTSLGSSAQRSSPASTERPTGVPDKGARGGEADAEEQGNAPQTGGRDSEQR